MSEFNFTEFFAMGGYAKYVWSSWLITTVGMLWLIFHAVNKRKTILSTLNRQAKQQDARKKRSATTKTKTKEKAK